MSTVLGRQNQYSLIPCVGATRTQHVASILSGWGLKFVIVIDNDKEGRSVKRTIERYGSEHVLVISTGRDEAIEDVFGPIDFANFVLPQGVHLPQRGIESNSKYAAMVPGGKKAIARAFAERVSTGFSGKFSSATRKKFAAVFDEIQKRFEMERAP
jgi:hypothetical protein